MVNAQEWLNKEYPINRRNEITELDISKGKVKKWLIHDSTLKGDLNLTEFTNLQILNCSGHELTGLNVSGCRYLAELDCQNNKLNNLNFSNCPNLEKINCDFNKYLKEIDISDCLNLTEIGPGFAIENGKLIKNVPQIVSAKENSIRNILIIGITGSGKSALANALVSESGKNQFGEKNSSTSATKSFKTSNIFEYQGKKYRIIDNIGFGDTNNITEEEILLKVGEGIHAAKEGINQVLFVFKDRFSPEHVMAFNLFENFISETGITKFATIIRTNFPSFKKEDKCEKDKQDLIDQTKELNQIISSCNGIIHVDNPAIPEIDEDDSDNEREIAIHSKKRKESREKVLNHLAENCSEIYKLKKWDSINFMMDDYKKRIEKTDSSEEERKAVKNETAQGLRKEIEASVGVSVPQIGVSANAAFKYKIQN